MTKTSDILRGMDSLRGFVLTAVEEIENRDKTIEILKQGTGAELLEHQEALDIVAKWIENLCHCGIIDEVLYKHGEQTKRDYLKLVEHPAYKNAIDRKRQKYWQHLERASREVDSWPEWKKGRNA